MGIPQYLSWLQRAFPNAFQQHPPRKQNLPVEHVYIDLNCYFHNVVKRANSPEQLVGLIQREIDGLLNNFAPQYLKSVFLAVDGPASQAKMLTQRIRRRKKQSSSLSIGLSPGTTLMRLLCDRLPAYCENVAKKRKIDVVFSDGFVPGEGEHKIIEAIMRNDIPTRSGHAKHCVVGSDSDLFLIMLGADANCVYVWDGDCRPGLVWTRNTMLKGILSAFPPKALQSNSDAEMAIRTDFSLLSLLKGDDYLPPLISFETAFRTYDKIVKQACQTQPVAQWAIVAKRNVAIRDLQSDDQDDFNFMRDYGDAADLVVAQHSFRPTLTLARCVADEKMMPESQFRSVYGKPAKFPENEVTALKNYYRGILWVLDIYRNGRALDYHFVYKLGNAKLDGRWAAMWMVHHQNTEFTQLRGPVNKNDPATGGAICPTTATLCLIPVSSLKGVFTKENFNVIEDLVQPDSEFLGPVVSFEDDSQLDRLKKTLVAAQKAFDARTQQLKEQNVEKKHDSEWNKLKQALVTAQGAYAARRTDFVTADIDDVDVSLLDQEVRSRFVRGENSEDRAWLSVYQQGTGARSEIRSRDGVPELVVDYDAEEEQDEPMVNVDLLDSVINLTATSGPPPGAAKLKPFPGRMNPLRPLPGKASDILSSSPSEVVDGPVEPSQKRAKTTASGGGSSSAAPAVSSANNPFAAGWSSSKGNDNPFDHHVNDHDNEEESYHDDHDDDMQEHVLETVGKDVPEDEAARIRERNRLRNLKNKEKKKRKNAEKRALVEGGAGDVSVTSNLVAPSAAPSTRRLQVPGTTTGRAQEYQVSEPPQHQRNNPFASSDNPFRRSVPRNDDADDERGPPIRPPGGGSSTLKRGAAAIQPGGSDYQDAKKTRLQPLPGRGGPQGGGPQHQTGGPSALKVPQVNYHRGGGFAPSQRTESRTGPPSRLQVPDHASGGNKGSLFSQRGPPRPNGKDNQPPSKRGLTPLPTSGGRPQAPSNPFG
ncbi:unnamed protein product [Amoebophrya sp. A120]|nr:unnamed protein product [Amoebophrya sp. A120]|eukprot:GSA120T00001475001.1